MTNSIDDIEKASCILVIGSNTSECHPIIAGRILKAKEKGAKLIVADPRHIHLSQYADVVLNHRLGSDVALINGLMHLIIKNSWHNREFIASRTEGFEETAELCKDYTPERVEALTGVSSQDLVKAAELYSQNHPASLLYAMGITQHTTGVDNVKSCCNLALLTGNVGCPGSGVNPLRGQNNVQGACDMGGLPNVLTGYQSISDPEVRERFTAAWGRDIPQNQGMTVTDMVQGMETGKIKGLYVIGENPKLSDPDLNHLGNALKKLDILVVQDLFLSETSQVADVVLAAASSAEKEGTVTNTERRCMHMDKAIDPIGEALPDWEIICRFSKALGYDMDYHSPEEIFNEIARLTPKSYGGMSYERLGLDGLQWPCPTLDHPGTPYLHEQQFARGKGRFHALEYQAPAEVPDETYPFSMTTGRMFAHFHTGTMTRISDSLDKEQPTGYAEINPEDAERLEVREGETLILASRRGEIEIPARISQVVPSGTVFVPIHFGENPTNLLTNPAFDPLAKIPEFKVGSVHVKKLWN